MSEEPRSPMNKSRDHSLETEGRNHLPLPTGPYKTVGCRDFLVGLSRKNGVLARFYYPAQIDNNDEQKIDSLLWPNWLPHEDYWQGLFDVINLRSDFLFYAINKIIKKDIFIPAIPNAKLNLLPDNKKYPVVVFSHGLGGFRAVNASICIELASYGFLVAAIEHRDNSACLSFCPKNITSPSRTSSTSDPKLFDDNCDEENCDIEFEDTSVLPPRKLKTDNYKLPHLESVWIRHHYSSVLSLNVQTYQFRNKQVHRRVHECIRCLELLEALNSGQKIINLFDQEYDSEEFKNVLDMEKLTAMGQSLGGASVLLAATVETRFKVIVALDPWMYPVKNENLELISQPTLILLTESLSRSPNLKKIEEFVKSSSNNIRTTESQALILKQSFPCQQWILPFVFSWVSNFFSYILGFNPSLQEIHEFVDSSNQDKPERLALTIKGSNHWQQCDIPFVLNGVSLIIARLSSLKPTSSMMAHDLTCYHSLQFISKHLDLPLVDDLPIQFIQQHKNLVRPLIL